MRVEPRRTLVDAIRDDCGQTGTHIGCEHGVCGTCTVIVDDEAVPILPDVRGPGRRQENPHRRGARQWRRTLRAAACLHRKITGCSAAMCTPGFLMLATNVLERDPHIGDEELLDVLSSNLCRCTGYQNIIKAVRAAAAQLREAASPA